MAKVIVFHYTDKGRLPKLGKEDLVKIKNTVVKALSEEYPNVKFNGTYVDEEGRGICDWEAPSAEVVKEIVDKYIKAPYDAVIKVEPALL